MPAVATAAAFLAIVALLAVASVTDVRRRQIPNRVVLSVAVVWLLWRCGMIALGAAPVVSLLQDALCALLFGGVLLAFVALSECVTGRFMMGGGDIKLLAALALFLGVQGIVVALLAACIVSLAFASARLSRGIPFAPCILCGVLVATLAC